MEELIRGAFIVLCILLMSVGHKVKPKPYKTKDKPVPKKNPTPKRRTSYRDNYLKIEQQMKETTHQSKLKEGE